MDFFCRLAGAPLASHRDASLRKMGAGAPLASHRDASLKNGGRGAVRPKGALRREKQKLGISGSSP